MLIPREKAPELIVETLEHGTFNLAVEKPERLTLISFYRGLHCPICANYLMDLERLTPEFAKRGVETIAISSDDETRARQMEQKIVAKSLRVGYGLRLGRANGVCIYPPRAGNLLSVFTSQRCSRSPAFFYQTQSDDIFICLCNPCRLVVRISMRWLTHWISLSKMTTRRGENTLVRSEVPPIWQVPNNSPYADGALAGFIKNHPSASIAVTNTCGRSTSEEVCMLRILTVIAFLLPSAIATAADDDWQPYSNARFGYVLDIPPGFELQTQGDEGGGASFHANDNGATLAVFGSAMGGDFETDVNDRIGYEREGNWRIVYSRVTTAWASFSGSRGKDVFYTRAVALCDGRAAYFRLQYRKSRLTSFDGVISRMAEALRPSEGCQHAPVTAAASEGPK